MIQWKTLALGFGLFAAGCAGPRTQVESPRPLLPSERKITSSPFSGLKGCFLLYNLKTDTFDQVIGETCKERFPACSTFKVPLAVVAFDSGFLKDENQVLKWNGKTGSRPEERKDHNAKTWMSDSVVWVSQEVTSKLGKKKTQTYLNDFDYGNKDLAGGLTQAWLVAPSSKGPALKITAYEQIDFMKKLWRDELPASKRAMELTRQITFIETSPNGFRLSGKTGSNFYDKARQVQFGWFVSHLQKDDQEYLAVTNISDLAATDVKGYGGPRARTITKELLAELGLW